MEKKNELSWDMKFVNTVVQDVLSQHEIKINPIFVLIRLQSHCVCDFISVC